MGKVKRALLAAKQTPAWLRTYLRDLAPPALSPVPESRPGTSGKEA